MRHGWMVLGALAVSLSACNDAPPGAATNPDNPPTATATVKQTASAAPTASSTARPSKTMPAIRDTSTVGAFSSGAALEVRAYVSRLTTQDPILIAIRVRPEKPIEKGHPWLDEKLDLKEVLPKLTFTVEGPSGKHELTVADPPSKSHMWRLSDFRQAIGLDGASLTLRQGSGVVANKADAMVWKTPQPALISKPGKYTVTVSGEIKTSAQTFTLASKPLEIEVVEAGPTQKTLAELEAEALEIANEGAASTPMGPTPTGPPVEDVDGNRSFELRGQSMGYDVDMVEVVLDPSGKLLNVLEYEHFTCVAAGTPIATPAGSVPVESLAIGQAVSSFDVDSGSASIATVLQIRSAPAERLVRFGDLRVTGSHPLFADGTWTRADDVTPGAVLLGLDGSRLDAAPALEAEPVTVYDISVSEPNTYFAGGVLVHNKSVSVPLHGGAPWGGWFSRRSAAK